MKSDSYHEYEIRRLQEKWQHRNTIVFWLGYLLGAGSMLLVTYIDVSL